jgi:Fe-S-cluster containining protein
LVPFNCNHNGACNDVRLCCIDTEMTLTREDAERIDTLGHSRKDYLIRASDGFCQLRNVEGHCYFYDPQSKMCEIYESRPEGCRFYPIIYHAGKRKCVVDKDCPSGETLARQEIRKVCHRVRTLVEKLRMEALQGESPC